MASVNDSPVARCRTSFAIACEIARSLSARLVGRSADCRAILHHVPDRDTTFDRSLDQQSDRLVAQATRRRVDHAQQRNFVGRLFDPFQIGDQITDLFAIEERLAAQHHVGNLGFAQFRFEQSRLFVGAKQDGDVARLNVIAFDQLGDFADDRFRFGGLVLVLLDPRTRTLGTARESASCRDASCCS